MQLRRLTTHRERHQIDQIADCASTREHATERRQSHASTEHSDSAPDRAMRAREARAHWALQAVALHMRMVTGGFCRVYRRP